MSNISVIGAGYVGLVTAACFAEFGHKVNLIEIEPERVNSLRNGIFPVAEEGLPELWHRHYTEGRLSVTGDYVQGLAGSEFAFVAVGTPSTSNGKPDLKWVRAAAKSIADSASGPIVIVLKSTVPVGTAEIVARILAKHCRNGYNFPVVSNPEFLREGVAVFDFMNPSRIVVGASDQTAARAVEVLYEKIDAPVIRCDNRTAEMSKYVSNVFLATRISFINEIALLCDQCGVDIVQVEKIVGAEPRCGEGYLRAGLGWGGSCLPKDVRGLIHLAKSQRVPLPLVQTVEQINKRQPYIIIEKLRHLLDSLEDKTIGILGLAFKANTDDMREAGSISLISLLEAEGCQVKAYDPLAMATAAKIMPDVHYCTDAYEVATGSDALILVTEWDEFRYLDMKRISTLMKTPVMVDSRNFYDPEEMVKTDFTYEGMGRHTNSTIKLESCYPGTIEEYMADVLL
jgi:UDPglucose 6-dehydrogenase